MAKNETQAFFDQVAGTDRQQVTDLLSTVVALSDSLETAARSLSRQLQLMVRYEEDPAIAGRIEELQQTCRALVRETGNLELAASAVSKVEQQLHRIVGEITPAAEAAGYKVKP